MTRLEGTDVEGRPYAVELAAAVALPLAADHPTTLAVATAEPGGHQVIVKTPARADDAEATARVDREREFVQRLAGIRARRLPFFGSGAAPVPHVLTRYVPGRVSLAEHLRSHGVEATRSSDWVEGLLREVTAQLVDVERAGIVHRDVKPGNLLVGGDGQGRLVPGDVGLIDLGHACAPGDHRLAALTLPQSRVGTPGWMGPAQVRGLPAEPWWDVVNLGLVAAWVALGAPQGAPLPLSPAEVTEDRLAALAEECATSSLRPGTARLVQVALVGRRAPSAFRRELEEAGPAPAGPPGGRGPAGGEPRAGAAPAAAADPLLPPREAWAEADRRYRELREEQDRRRASRPSAAHPEDAEEEGRWLSLVTLAALAVLVATAALIVVQAVARS